MSTLILKGGKPKRLHWKISYSAMAFWQIPQREALRFCCCWLMISLQQTQTHKSPWSIRGWQYAGLTAERPPVCRHHSLWFMLSWLPQPHWTPCVVSASGTSRFVLLLSLGSCLVSMVFSSLLSFMAIIPSLIALSCVFAWHICIPETQLSSLSVLDSELQ